MSAHSNAETQSQTENKLDASKKSASNNETVASLASSALRSVAYEAIQQPLTSFGQYVDHFKKDAHLTEKLQIIAPVQEAKFGSLEWHVDQVAAAAGQMIPYLASRRLVKPFFAEKALLSETKFLTKPSALRFSIAEASATGFISQTLFHPVSDTDNFWKEKAIDGGKGAATMATLTATTHGLSSLAETRAASRLKISQTLKNPFLSGIISGAPAGLLGAEMESVHHDGKLASLSDITKSIYGMSMVGGTFGALAMRSKNSTSKFSDLDPEISKVPQKSQITELEASKQGPGVKVGEQIPLDFGTDFRLPPAYEAPLAVRTISPPEAATPRRNANNEQTQLELKYPDPLSPVGKKAFELLTHLEKLSSEENAKIFEGKYPITVNEAQAIHVLLDEWVPGAQRLYNQISSRGAIAQTMAYDAWVYSSLSQVKTDLPKIYERALIARHPENDSLARDKFVGQYYEKPLGLETPEEVDKFLSAWKRSGPLTRWLDSTGDIHCPKLLEMIRWGHVDEIPDAALKPIAEHFRVYSKPFEAETDVDALIAAAPGWSVAPLLPIDMATEVAKLPPIKRLAADAAVIATRDQFEDKGDSARAFFEGKDSEAIRPVFFSKLDEISQLSPRAILKKTQWEDNLSLAVDILHGDSLSAEHKFALLQGLNSFYKAPKILATMDVPTFKDAYDKLIADNPVEKDHENERYYDWQSRNAVILASVFKKNWSTWLDAQQKAGRDNFKATNWLRATEPAEVKGLSQFLLQHGKKPVNQLERISDAWSEIKESGKVDSFKEALRIGLLSKYKTINDSGFAEEASRWSVPADKYEEYERRFLASKDVPSPFPLEQRFTVGGLTGRFIPRDDPRGLFIGEYTNCCQHPDGNAESSAWYGQESPKSGFFVVEDADGEVVAQSWAVVTDSGGMLFDNVEAKGLEKRQNAVKQIYLQAANFLTDRFHTVTMGTENSDLDLAGIEDAGVKTQPMPVDFSGYTDSKKQVILASSQTVAPNQFERAMLRGALNLDKGAMSDISKQRFPDGWQALPWERSTRGLILDHNTEGVLGYALYEPGNRYVSDIAVKPGIHPKYGHTLTANLFRTLKSIGGDWTADMRSSTSYRMLQRASKLGHVKIISDTIDEEPMGTEEMHHVVFNVDKTGTTSTTTTDSTATPDSTQSDESTP